MNDEKHAYAHARREKHEAKMKMWELTHEYDPSDRFTDLEGRYAAVVRERDREYVPDGIPRAVHAPEDQIHPPRDLTPPILLGDDARVVEDGTVHEVDVPHVCRILIDDVEVDVDLQELYRVYHHGDHVHRRGHRRLVDIIIHIIIDLGGGEFLRGPFESEFVRGQLGEVVG